MQSSKIKYSNASGKYTESRRAVHERILVEIRGNSNFLADDETAILHLGPVNSPELPNDVLNIAEIRGVLPFEVQNVDWYYSECVDLLKSLVFDFSQEGKGVEIRVDNLRLRELQILLKSLEKTGFDIEIITYEGEAQPNSKLERYIAQNYSKTLKSLEKYGFALDDPEDEETTQNNHQNDSDDNEPATESTQKPVTLQDFPTIKGYRAKAFKTTANGYVCEYRNTGLFALLIPIQLFKTFDKNLKPLEK